VGRGGALVTGANRRIGRALALEAARCGYAVCVHHHSHEDEALAVVAEIEGLGARAAPLSAELMREEEAQALVARAAKALGEPLTLLVNSAAAFVDDRVGSLSRELWDLHMSVNLRAPVVLAEAFAAQLPADRPDALVLNLIDQRVLRPNPQFFSYSLSKAALFAATKTLAQALAPRIRVVGVGPGPTLANVHQRPGEFAAEAAGTLLGRPVDPREICDALRYLIDARSVTGQMIAVDGGQHLGWRTPDIVSE
jgi:NAD(P)-dependent dehydrogenase (short-subunit alcohol dehydrogenase family)